MKRVLLLLLISPLMLNAQWIQTGDDIDGDSANDEFGTSVSLNASGNRIVIGARTASVIGIGSPGHVKVYENNGGVWTQMGNTVEGTTTTLGIGSQVSFNDEGNIFVTSSYSSNNFVGFAAVYENINGAWTQIGSNIEGIGASDLFGFITQINASGTRFVSTALDQVRVYENVNSVWTQLGADILTESPGEQMISADINDAGDRIIIGAYENDDVANNSGQVRIYDLIGGVWTQVGSDINGGTEFDRLGAVVKFNSDGTKFITSSTAEYVEIYEFTNNDWSQVGSEIVGEQSNGNFGLAIDINSDGTLVVIGASTNDAGNSNNSANFGSTSVFRDVNGVWTQIGSDIDGEDFQDLSGYSVSMNASGDTIAIGAYLNDGNGSDAGHVRLFNEPSLTIEDIDVEGFKIYPNPCHNYINIQFEQSLKNGLIKVYDILGKKVKEIKSKEDNHIRIDVSDLQSGLYIIQINNGLVNKRVKIIVE